MLAMHINMINTYFFSNQNYVPIYIKSIFYPMSLCHIQFASHFQFKLNLQKLPPRSLQITNQHNNSYKTATTIPFTMSVDHGKLYKASTPSHIINSPGVVLHSCSVFNMSHVTAAYSMPMY